MARASTKAKLKYNRGAYRRYEFNLGVDSKLNALVERYKSHPDGNLSNLVKALLCGYFGIGVDESDNHYSPYHLTKGGTTPNTELDKYFSRPPAEAQ